MYGKVQEFHWLVIQCSIPYKQGSQAETILSVAGHKYGVHDYVCINLSPKIAEATETSTTAIARVLEIRAHSTKDVYLRVFWMYRPDQLPWGLEPHHGSDELIASNVMDIVDATSVRGRADVTHWIEEQQEEAPDGIYWRQTFDHLTRQLSVSF